MITDERFASAQSDPRFMEAPKRHSKVTIDSRFQGIFTDRNFTSSRAPVDKRGKPKIDNASTSITHYYRLDQQENDQQADGDRRAQIHQIGNRNESESESESESEGDDVDGDGQSVDESSSTSTTDSDDDNYVGEEEEEDTFMLQVGISSSCFLCKMIQSCNCFCFPCLQEDNVPEIDKETRRLAIVNLDWSQVRVRFLNFSISFHFMPFTLGAHCMVHRGTLKNQTIVLLLSQFSRIVRIVG